VEARCRELRDCLIEARRAVDKEIRSYPTPIPRCDAQFNFLYEQRSRLSLVLERLNAAYCHDDAETELAKLLADFAASASFSDSTRERDLRLRIGTRPEGG
jgi:hypothetical protein